MNTIISHKRLSTRRSATAFLCAISLLGLLGCAVDESISQQPPIAANFEVTPPPNFTRGLLERRAPEPLYPLRARNLGVEGWVMLGFSVNADGEVLNNSIRTIQEQPEGYFEVSAKNAARRLSFQNIRGALVEDIRYVFRYQLEGLDPPSPTAPAEIIQFREMLPLRLITPAYPEVAQELGLEGFVVLRFSVSESGAVSDIVIDQSEPPGVFDAEAIRATQRLRFDPRIVVGEPVRVEDVSYRFDWQLAQ